MRTVLQMAFGAYSVSHLNNELLMGYLIFLLTIAVYLLRPAEWIPFLQFNWNMLLNGIGILIIIGKILKSDSSINSDRTTIYLGWFTLAILTSSAANLQFGTIELYFSQLVSIIVTYVLAQAVLVKAKQIDKFILLFVLLQLFICFQCYLQVTRGVNWGGLEPYSRGILGTRGIDGFELAREAQIIWFGVFGDPNDLGMLLIAFIPYMINKLFYQTSSTVPRLFWLGSILIIAYTIFLTNSRGTMVALLVGLSAFYIIKKKSVWSLGIALFFGMLVFAVGPSRLSQITSGDSSAMGRIYAWIEALGLFRRDPIFGVGADRFLEYHHVTTHNSFVLALAETGMFGFIPYLSLFIISIYTAIKVSYQIEDKKVSVEIISLVSGLIGITAAIFFISRTYVLLPYLYIAVLMSYLRIHSPELHNKNIKQLSIYMLVGLSVGGVVFIYLFNRLSTNLLL